MCVYVYVYVYAYAYAYVLVYMYVYGCMVNGVWFSSKLCCVSTPACGQHMGHIPRSYLHNRSILHPCVWCW